jgi:8-oxo-dGTP pyrophosphatase MutT (NUDIX family)
MPQKKNPDIAELTRGKTGRLYGNLISLLTTMKGLPLAYNRDMQEDKEAIFDSVDTAKAALQIFAEMMDGASFREDRMAEAAADPSLLATDLADRLVIAGIPFRKAHEIVGKLVSTAAQRNVSLDRLDSQEFLNAASVLTPKVIQEAFHGLRTGRAPGSGSTVQREHCPASGPLEKDPCMNNDWRILSSEKLCETPYLRVNRQHVATPSRPDGVTWVVARRHTAAVVAPRTVDGKFIMIRQERIAVQKVLWEFPAGQVDGEVDEKAIYQTALRELGEEAGVTCSTELIALGYFFSSVGFTDECCHLFLARDVVPRVEGFDHDEHEAILLRCARSPKTNWPN